MQINEGENWIYDTAHFIWPAEFKHTEIWSAEHSLRLWTDFSLYLYLSHELSALTLIFYMWRISSFFFFGFIFSPCLKSKMWRFSNRMVCSKTCSQRLIWFLEHDSFEVKVSSLCVQGEHTGCPPWLLILKWKECLEINSQPIRTQFSLIIFSGLQLGPSTDNGELTSQIEIYIITLYLKLAGQTHFPMLILSRICCQLFTYRLSRLACFCF